MQCVEKTKKGRRCKNPAVAGEKKCAPHLRTAHRPTKLTDDVERRILQALRGGNYAEIAARHAGIHPSTYYDWLARGEAGEPAFAEFREAVQKASADGEALLVAKVNLASTEHWQAAMTLLERRHPERWARRQVLEHSGRQGGAIEHQVDMGDEETRELGHALLKRLAGAGSD